MLDADLIFALDPVRFAERALGIAPDPWQARVLRSSARQILLNCSRQAGKSTVTSILALHTAIYRPGSLVLLVSPSQRQSAELFRKVTDLLSKLSSAPTRTEDNRLSLQLENGSRVVSLPSSESTIRGFSAVSLIIEDEAAFVDDAVHTATRPMLAVSGGRLVLLSTPYGKRGHFYEAWTTGADWERVRVPADDCPRISREWLATERREVGEWRFRQEFGCEFVDTVDSVFSSDLVRAALDDQIEPLFSVQAAEPITWSALEAREQT